MPPRVAIVGAGLMGRWHAHAAHRAGARIAAIVDPDRARAARLASQHRGCVPLASLTDALDRADVVHICTPTGTHAPLAELAIDVGRHVLIEKPFADTVADTERLLARADARAVLACPVHQFVFQDGVQEAFRARAAIGPLRHVELAVCSAGAEGQGAAGRDEVAASVLPHLAALLVRLFPGAVADVEWAVRHPAAGELRGLAQIGDVTVALLVSMAGRPTRNRMELVGECGSVRADLFHGFAVTAGGGVSRVRKIAQPFVSGAAEIGAASRHLVRRAWNREPAYPGLAQLCARLYAAAEAGAPSPIAPAETTEVARTCDRIMRLAGIVVERTETR